MTPITNEPTNSLTVFLVQPTTGPDDSTTTALVKTLRTTSLPAAVQGTGISTSDVFVGGETAVLIDLTQRINERMLLIIGTVLAGSFILLMMVFRSLFVPFKAADHEPTVDRRRLRRARRRVQLGLAQGGHRFARDRHHRAFVPVMMFAILFGLSMDYEVFLLSRIREEYLRSGRPSQQYRRRVFRTRLE